MSPAIPNFTARTAPLRVLLEASYDKAGGACRKISIAKFRLSELGWADAHCLAFVDLQSEIDNATRLAHGNLSLKIYVFTDASDRN